MAILMLISINNNILSAINNNNINNINYKHTAQGVLPQYVVVF